MAAVDPRKNLAKNIQLSFLLLLYICLYFPIFYIIYLSFMENSVWPFPPIFTLEWYHQLFSMSNIHVGLKNSIVIAIGTGIVSSFFASISAIGILRYQSRLRALFAVIYVMPLFVAHVLIGISVLMFNNTIFQIQGNIWTAIIANSTYCVSFAFLVIIAQILSYNWQLDDAAMVFGATPFKCFKEVTFPIIWPAILGAFIVSFLLSFNDFTITFYNIGASPTLSTIAWGTMRHMMAPELYAMASIVISIVFICIGILYGLMKSGFLRLGIPE